LKESDLERKWQDFHCAHANYRWISKKGNRIQGRVDKKRKQDELTPRHWFSEDGTEELIPPECAEERKKGLQCQCFLNSNNNLFV
jgi:hypothetical protein